MLWRYLIKAALFPPGIFILGLLLAWLLRRKLPTTAQVLFVSFLTALWLFATPKMQVWLAAPLEVDEPFEFTQQAARPDVIVVLGGGQRVYSTAWGGHQLSQHSLQRLVKGVELAQELNVPLLLTGGEHFGQPPSEAEVMAALIARTWQVPQPVFLETQSRTTWENAVYSAKIVREQQWHHILLVSDRWHLPRASWSFAQQGLQVTTAPIFPYGFAKELPLGGWLPDAQTLFQNTQLLNEWLGLIAYKIVYTR